MRFYKEVTMKNMLRVAAVTPKVHIGSVSGNVREIMDIYEEYKDAADVIVTPELSITGYTCADLFENRKLIDGARRGLLQLAMATCTGQSALVVGLPFEVDGELFNCAAFLQGGRVVAIVPKTYLPNYGEFYEKRWFSARKYDAVMVNLMDPEDDGDELEYNAGSKKAGDRAVGSEVLFGNNVMIEMGSGDQRVKLGIEICEDAWTPVSPGRLLAMAGAEVILNLSASNEVIGKAAYRHKLIGSVSSDCLCGYVYVSAGMYESTSDLVFSGHNLMYENGKLLGEVKPFEDGVLIRDISLTKIRHDRIANKSFADCKRDFAFRKYETVVCDTPLMDKGNVLMKVKMTPFVPSGNKLERCMAIFKMQVDGLQRRIEATHCKCVVVGVSGGLDSTLALLVSAQAVKNAGLPSTTVVGITMPGFGTTNRTKNNSTELMRLLGCDSREISIAASVRQHFADIGQDESVHDVTYENCQARERTQILMDVANKEGGFVVGTGDLSELALGWCTYNGDHMSMYGVNASIPKTLVRHIVQYYGDTCTSDTLRNVLYDILDTPVSPELLPTDESGTEMTQKTEDLVGPYELHDFFLYYGIRWGFEPSKVKRLAKYAFEGDYPGEVIDKWLKTFYRRFFSQQFKRSCLPDGAKIGSVTLSPRGDWRMPSDAVAKLWLEDIDK